MSDWVSSQTHIIKYPHLILYIQTNITYMEKQHRHSHLDVQLLESDLSNKVLIFKILMVYWKLV